MPVSISRFGRLALRTPIRQLGAYRAGTRAFPSLGVISGELRAVLFFSILDALQPLARNKRSIANIGP